MSEQKCCGTCRFFERYYPMLKDDEPEDMIGQCLWFPEGGLPPTWRYAPSEVTGTSYPEGTDCLQHQPIEEETQFLK